VTTSRVRAAPVLATAAAAMDGGLSSAVLPDRLVDVLRLDPPRRR